jgi:hypothetical protein
MAKAKSKQCLQCKKRKPMDDFVESARAKDGRMNYCRPCHGKRCKTAREKSQKLKAKNGITNGVAHDKRENAKVDALNAALRVTNGKPNGKRSQFRAPIRELFQRFAKEGFDVENIEFDGPVARVKYSRVEEIVL